MAFPVTRAEPGKEKIRITFRSGIFVALADYEYREALKSAGFSWHRGRAECSAGPAKCRACKAGLKTAWWTWRAEAAARLSTYADPEAAAALAKHIKAVERSRAVDADIDVPCNKGLSYLGYQKAGIAYLNEREGSLLGDEQGCLAGDTIISVSRAGGTRKYKLSTLYERFNGLKGSWDHKIPSLVKSLTKTGFFRLNHIKKVFCKGVQNTLRINLRSGKTITLTPDHEIATTSGEQITWKPASEIAKGDEVLTNGVSTCLRCFSTEAVVTAKDSKYAGNCRKCIYRYLRRQGRFINGRYTDSDGYVQISSQHDHPRSNCRGTVYEHILVAEKKYKRPILRSEHVHHINGVRNDNRPENLKLLTPREHLAAHNAFLHMDGGKAGTGGMVRFIPRKDKVHSVSKGPRTDVYDIVMSDPDRNFVANGIVVHNCGKTIQILGLVNLDKTIKNILIICPASLRINWKREAQRWLVKDDRHWVPYIVDADEPIPPHSNFVIIHYNRVSIGYRACKGECGGEKRKPLTCTACNGTGTGRKSIVVCGNCQGRKYVFCKICGGRGKIAAINLQVIDSIKKRQWDLVVADEAHFLKNITARRTKAILGDRYIKRPGIADLGRKRIFMTGTPIPNRPVEIWPIVSALAPKEFGNFKAFAQRYCGGHEEFVGKNKKIFKFDGASNLEELQERLRAHCMIRRLKVDVLKDLPPKVRQVIPLMPSPEAKILIAQEMEEWEKKFGSEIALVQAALSLSEERKDPNAYDQAVEKLKYIQRVAFIEMARVRREVAVVKIPSVIEHLEEMFGENVGKIICFAHHREVIEKLLAHFGKEAVAIYGDISMADRQKAVDQFQDPKSPIKLFVGGIMAAGVGLTLTAASHVVFAELDWTPGVIVQCEDRSHRIGQRNSVLVQHLVLDGSLDARMAQMIVEKQEISDRALDKTTDVAIKGVVSSRVEADVEPVPLWRKSALKEALIALAMRRDPTYTDGHGFNQMDATIGQSMATQKGTLSDKQAQIANKLVEKYKRQVPEPLARQLGIYAPPEPPKPQRPRRPPPGQQSLNFPSATDTFTKAKS